MEYLLGIDGELDYIVDMDDSRLGTRKIFEWWAKRWLRNRILSDNVLSMVGQHSLSTHGSHGAIVVLPDM